MKQEKERSKERNGRIIKWNFRKSEVNQKNDNTGKDEQNYEKYKRSIKQQERKKERGRDNERMKKKKG